MIKYNVTPYVDGGVQDGFRVLDLGETKQVSAMTPIKAALQHRPEKVQFWHLRKVK